MLSEYITSWKLSFIVIMDDRIALSSSWHPVTQAFSLSIGSKSSKQLQHTVSRVRVKRTVSRVRVKHTVSRVRVKHTVSRVRLKRTVSRVRVKRTVSRVRVKDTVSRQE